MQSKTAFVLLGLLKKKAHNPYEIIKILDKLNMSRWCPISSSSVYMTIRALEKKGFIEGRKEKNSAMPEKTIYAITPSGSAAFMIAVKEYMCDDVTDITRFNLSTLFMCHFSKDDVIKMLKARKMRLAEHCEKTKLAYSQYKNVMHVPEFALISLQHTLNFFQFELVSIEKTISVIECATGWDYFPTIESV